MFQVQADIAGRVAEALDVALGAPQKKTLAEKPTENLAAYEAFLKGEEAGRGLAVADPRAIRRAIDYYGQAVALDSAFAQAWVQLSRAHSSIYNVGTPTAPRRRRAARRRGAGAAAGAERPEIQLALGDYQQFVRIDAAAALAAYELGPPEGPDQRGTAQRHRPGRAEPRALAGRRRALRQGQRRRSPLGAQRPPPGHRPALAPALSRGGCRLRSRAGDLAPHARCSIRARPWSAWLRATLPARASVLSKHSSGRRADGRSSRTLRPTGICSGCSTTTSSGCCSASRRRRSTTIGERGASPSRPPTRSGATTPRRAPTPTRPRAAFEEQIKATPDNAQLYVLLGTALAYAGPQGRRDAPGQARGRETADLKDAYQGAYIQHQLARIYILVGEPDKALDQLEPLLETAVLPLAALAQDRSRRSSRCARTRGSRNCSGARREARASRRRSRPRSRDRYLLERELGRGGMATVYLAQDLKHDRPVALKVLHPELAASLGPERFLREIKLAARLQHPHIMTVLDSGESAGQLWFTMPYVEGESLRDRLTRERQLPIADAVRLTREAALALDFAHRQGVVHRDIKPENILLVDGQALVADFGIARALERGRRAAAHRDRRVDRDAGLHEPRAGGRATRSSTPGPTSTASARCCTRCWRASRRSRRRRRRR